MNENDEQVLDEQYDKLHDDIQSCLDSAYEYNTSHPDNLSEIKACLFSDYADRDDLEVVYVDSFFNLKGAIDESPSVGEIEVQLDDSIIEGMKALDEDRRENLKREFNISDDGLAYVVCSGHYALVPVESDED